MAARAGVERKKRCQVPGVGGWVLGTRGWGLGPREKQIINTNSRSYGLLPTANCLLFSPSPQHPVPVLLPTAYCLPFFPRPGFSADRPWPDYEPLTMSLRMTYQHFFSMLSKLICSVTIAQKA